MRRHSGRSTPFKVSVIEEHTCLGRAKACGLRIGKAARGSETPEEDQTRPPRQLRPTCHVMGRGRHGHQYNPLGPCSVGDKHWSEQESREGQPTPPGAYGMNEFCVGNLSIRAKGWGSLGSPADTVSHSLNCLHSSHFISIPWSEHQWQRNWLVAADLD